MHKSRKSTEDTSSTDTSLLTVLGFSVSIDTSMNYFVETPPTETYGVYKDVSNIHDGGCRGNNTISVPCTITYPFFK